MTHNAADRQLIMETTAKYAFGYDEADFALLADSFTENATSGGKVTGTDIAWGPMNGRAEIVSVLESIRQSQTDQRRHCMSNFLFTEQTETTAKFRCFLNLIAAENGASRSVSGGWYDVDAVKEADGVWRMSRMDGVLDSPF